MSDDVDTWSIYEARKREFVAAHPSCSCAEYEAFIRALCDELGI